MIKPMNKLAVVFVVASLAVVSAQADVPDCTKSDEGVTLTFSKPTNEKARDVTVTVAPGDEVKVSIPPNTKATEKRDLIAAALDEKGYDVCKGPKGNQLKILYLAEGTEVKFSPNQTGEAEDKIVAPALVQGSVGFQNEFDPVAYDGDLAVFRAGFVTGAGKVVAQVSAEDLNFQTDGPHIAQLLWEQLVWQAPNYGVDVLYAGDRLDFFFDPEMTGGRMGIVFGTTSPTPGCSGAVVVGAAGSGLDNGAASDAQIGALDAQTITP
ncbi:MAG: hypothetical protein KKB50_04045 [Planctomycetes bacterium]|nr:hypothetical protein [Planctomycetota bacterium]